jgi:methylated-DNA-[protein]-cysteine S-methyltransferase
MLYRKEYNSTIGKITLLGDESYLYGVWFEGQQHFGAGYKMDEIKTGETKSLQQGTNWLDQYFAGEQPSTNDLPLKPEVTLFRRRVLAILQTIPYGQQISYKTISDLLQTDKTSARNLSRAVGGAVGHNPISIIIPCHRVIGSNGALTGYAGGIERKEFLLQLERKIKS